MEALIPGGSYVNAVAERQTIIGGGPYFLDHIATFTLTKYRPLSDVSAGNWTASSGSDLYAMVNEVSPDDANYAQSGLGPINDAMKLRFAAPGLRPVNTDHTIRYRIKVSGTLDMTVRLKQGVTTIKTWVHSPAPTVATTYEQVLSPAEAATITTSDPLDLETEAG